MSYTNYLLEQVQYKMQSWHCNLTWMKNNRYKTTVTIIHEKYQKYFKNIFMKQNPYNILSLQLNIVASQKLIEV